MTEQELREKIIKALEKEIEYVVVCGSSVKNVCINHIADALIAAGIGDVETVQKIAASATAMAVLEAAKAEHRAEVAERALKLAGDKFVNEVCNIMDKENNPCDYDCYDCFYNYFKNQAEKELQEERKND